MKDLINDPKIVVAIITTLSTITISILGFYLDFKKNKRTLLNEISKNKSNKQIDKLQDIPIELVECIKLVSRDNDEEFLTKKVNVYLHKIDNLINEISAYGSEDALKLSGHIKQFLTKQIRKSILNGGSISKYDKSQIISYLALLLCQLKFDLKGLFIKPNLYYRCSLDEYSEQYDEIYRYMVISNNNLINTLKLNELFIIEDLDIRDYQGIYQTCIVCGFEDREEIHMQEKFMCIKCRNKFLLEIVDTLKELTEYGMSPNEHTIEEKWMFVTKITTRFENIRDKVKNT